jgi:thiamine-monophosphate kinase
VAAGDGRDPAELAATGGDDYELLVSAPAARQGDLADSARAVGLQLTWIGEVTSGGPGAVFLGRHDEPVDALQGYEHS